MKGWPALVIGVLVFVAPSPACDYDERVAPGRYADPDAPDGAERPGTVGDCATEAGVAAVFARHCTSCHDADRPSAGLDLATPGLGERLTGRASVHADCRDLPLVVPGRPAEGLLMPKLLGTLVGCGDPMPPGDTLAPEELQCVARWIAASPAAPEPMAR